MQKKKNSLEEKGHAECYDLDTKQPRCTNLVRSGTRWRNRPRKKKKQKQRITSVRNWPLACRKNSPSERSPPISVSETNSQIHFPFSAFEIRTYYFFCCKRPSFVCFSHSFVYFALFLVALWVPTVVYRAGKQKKEGGTVLIRRGHP